VLSGDPALVFCPLQYGATGGRLRLDEGDRIKQPGESASTPTDEEWREVLQALARMSAAEQEIFLQYVRRVANGMDRAEAERLPWSETAALRMH